MTKFQTKDYVSYPVRVLGLDEMAQTLAGVTMSLSKYSPEGVISAPPGSTCQVRGSTPSADDGLWVKTTGEGNTGWTQAS